MGKRFKDRVVMITGAASGFGAAAARRFGEEGAHLCLSDINKDALFQSVTSLSERTFTEVFDVSDEAAMERHVAHILSRFGKLDIAINNAGMAHALIPLTALDCELFDNIMAVNARGVFLGMKYQLRAMEEQGEGVILNMSSAAGLVGAGHLAAYAASKHAVIGLTRAAADEVAYKGIRVNALCPSFAETPLFADIADDFAKRCGCTQEDAWARISARVPMKRVAHVDEIVQAMVWACDPENTFMTGQALSLDGGLTAI